MFTFCHAPLKTALLLHKMAKVPYSFSETVHTYLSCTQFHFSHRFIQVLFFNPLQSCNVSYKSKSVLPIRNMRLTTNKTGVVSWRITESSDLRNVGSGSVAALRLLTWLGENSGNTKSQLGLVSSQRCLSSHQQSFVSFCAARRLPRDYRLYEATRTVIS